MAVYAKGRRRLARCGQRDLRYVQAAYDAPDLLLHIVPEDKTLFMLCPLGRQFAVLRNSQFQGTAVRGTARLRAPFPVPEIITPQITAELIDRAERGRDAVRLTAQESAACSG